MPRENENLALIQLPTDELSELLTNLGIVQPPSLLWLSNVVQPVALVDSRVAINATTTPAEFDARATAGELVGSAIGTVHADTGPLPAGRYEFFLSVDHVSNVVQGWRVQHRNAANAADITSHILGGAIQHIVFSFVEELALNERLRIVNAVAAGAGNITQGTIWHRQL